MRRPPWRTRSVIVAVCAGALLGSAAPVLAQDVEATAAEIYPVPADGVFPIEGHGWGHGHGMSQWGAQGAAKQGVDAETIVSTYYPGTTRAVLADAPIRVKLDGDEGRDTVLVATPGLTVTDLASSTSAVLPAGPDAWKVTIDAAGLQLSSRTNAVWTPSPLSGTGLGGPVRFGGTTVNRVLFPDGTARDYRGAVQAVRTSATALATVAVIGLEDYLLGVVPRESSSSWEPAALEAQSIAARSYSAWKRSKSGGAAVNWDICDTTQCQVFGGSRLVTRTGTVLELEPATTTRAVQATRGVIRTYAGEPIFAEYSSSNGGWSSDGGKPYLIPRRDDWDGALPNPVHSWQAALRVSDIERRFPEVGSLRTLQVTGRDGNGEWGGRVKTVVLEGVDSSGAPTRVATTGAAVYKARSWPASADGLRSNWWHVKAYTAGVAPGGSGTAGPTVKAPGAPSAPGPGAPGPAASSPPVVAAPPVAVPTVAAPRPTVTPASAVRRITARLVAVGPRVQVRSRGTATVWYDVRNTGTVGWPVKGAVRSTAVRSPSRSKAWISASRPSPVSANRSAPGSRVIRPGQVGRVYVVIAGNGRPAGARVDSYGLAWDGVIRFPVKASVRYTIR